MLVAVDVFSWSFGAWGGSLVISSCSIFCLFHLFGCLPFGNCGWFPPLELCDDACGAPRQSPGTWVVAIWAMIHGWGATAGRAVGLTATVSSILFGKIMVPNNGESNGKENGK